VRRGCGVTFRQVILLLRYIALRNFTAISVCCYDWLNRDKSFSIQSDKKTLFSQSGIVKVSNCPARMCNGYDSMLSIQFLHFSKFARCDDEVLVFMLQLKPALRLVVIGHVLSLWDLFHLVHITARHAMTQYMSCHIISSRRYLLER